MHCKSTIAFLTAALIPTQEFWSDVKQDARSTVKLYLKKLLDTLQPLLLPGFLNSLPSCSNLSRMLQPTLGLNFPTDPNYSLHCLHEVYSKPWCRPPRVQTRTACCTESLQVLLLPSMQQPGNHFAQMSVHLAPSEPTFLWQTERTTGIFVFSMSLFCKLKVVVV